MTINEFIDEYPDLDSYLDYIHDEFGALLKLKHDMIEVPIPLIGSSIKIHESQLIKLSEGFEPDGIPSFKYIDTFGIKFKNYYEFCISIQSDDYSWFEGNNWKTDQLKFKIGTTQFEIGQISSLMVLLTEPIHRISDLHYDFLEFASIKIVIKDSLDYKSEFSKGIYYLNSYYLKPIGFYAKLKSLAFNDEDPYELFNRDDSDAIFKVAKRTRNVQKRDFNTCEPLCLYNYAVCAEGEQRFISYYRVLEFFMEQGLIERTKEMRLDLSISNIDLIKELSIRHEEEQLLNLLKTVLTVSKRNKLLKYCLHKKIIKVENVINLTTELYKYRNSIVHAKERELINTRIPNPFKIDSDLDSWIYILDELARICIYKLNSK